uniref:Pickpocket protein 28-like n=1 Tax=Diabrotica virgifera virgifera TaxID=50390 RepID=A0A6P7GY66_DIAVI
MKQKYTNKHAKKPKSFLTIVYETYKDFAENTSIHGLKYTVKPDIGTPERIFWALIFFGGLISAIYMTFLFWERYVSNPTRATIKTYYAPTSSIPFPAVSICNVNTILETKLQVFIDSL